MTDWTPGSSGTPAWTELSDQVLSSASASITVSGIASTYRRFLAWLYVIKATNAQILLRINNDSGTTYSRQRVRADDTTADAARVTSQTSFALSANSIASGSPGLFRFEVEKAVSGIQARIGSTAALINTTPAIEYEAGEGLWNNTADLISRFDLTAASGTMAAGSRLILEGAP